MSFTYEHHPHVEARKEEGPVAVSPPGGRVNAFLASRLTAVVGTMWCAYAFAMLAFVALPTALRVGSPTVLINWLSSNFLQLILLPVIIVGQNIQASAADRRSEQTYLDAEAVLHEARQIQEHLKVQDAALSKLTGRRR